MSRFSGHLGFLVLFLISKHRSDRRAVLRQLFHAEILCFVVGQTQLALGTEQTFLHFLQMVDGLVDELLVQVLSQDRVISFSPIVQIFEFLDELLVQVLSYSQSRLVICV